MQSELSGDELSGGGRRRSGDGRRDELRVDGPNQKHHALGTNESATLAIDR